MPSEKSLQNDKIKSLVINTEKGETFKIDVEWNKEDKVYESLLPGKMTPKEQSYFSLMLEPPMCIMVRFQIGGAK